VGDHGQGRALSGACCTSGIIIVGRLRRSRGWKGLTDTNAGSCRTGRRDTPHVPEHLGMRAFGRDPFAEGMMASGHAYRSNRSNTWPHRPALQKRSTNPLPTGSGPHRARSRSKSNFCKGVASGPSFDPLYVTL
jgi:hypothetical protein